MMMTAGKRRANLSLFLRNSVHIKVVYCTNYNYNNKLNITILTKSFHAKFSDFLLFKKVFHNVFRRFPQMFKNEFISLRHPAKENSIFGSLYFKEVSIHNYVCLQECVCECVCVCVCVYVCWYV